MLVAEIHGHSLTEARNSEDYLTSTVFGHLRYLPPSIFWERFFKRATGLASPRGGGNLAEFAASSGNRISAYSSVRIHFWPKHASLGTPDLILCFSGCGLRPLVIVLEAKLWAAKSGTGEHDQLRRYLDILNDLAELELELDRHDLADRLTALLYLTPRESLTELEETSRLCEPDSRDRLFRAQWQDIAAAALQSVGDTSDSMSAIILRDISEFLRLRGFEYFDGFARLPVMAVSEADGDYYRGSKEFKCWTILPIPDLDKKAGRFYSDPDSSEECSALRGEWER